jgi:glycerophosphoryl diester phosphodiesterase
VVSASHPTSIAPPVVRRAAFLSLGLCLALLAAAVAAAAEPSLRERLQGPRVGAHAGGIWRIAPDTLKRFAAAHAAGADIIGLDLRLSRDGVPVVYHDETLDLRTWCDGPVHDKTVVELQTCRFKVSRERIPTLEEVLQWSAGQVVIDAEPKEIDTIEPAIALVQRYHAQDWLYLQSKSDPERYARARAADPRSALSFRVETEAELQWVLERHDQRLLIVELGPAMCRPEVIDRVRAASKIASVNAFRHGRFGELFGAQCAWAYRQGIGIAMSDRPGSCAAQRDRMRDRP